MKLGMIELLEGRSLRTKLLVGFVVLIALALTLGFGDLMTQQALVRQIHQLYEHELLGVSNAKDAQLHYVTMGRELRQALISGTREERDAAVRAVIDLDIQLRKEVSELRTRVRGEVNYQRLTQFEEAYALYKNNVDRAMSLLGQGDLAQARSFVASFEFQSVGQNVRNKMDDVVNSKERTARETKESALEVVDAARTRALLVLIGGVLLGAFASALVANSIRRPAMRVRDAVEQLAQGNLSIEVPHQNYPNELGDMARSVQVLQRVAQQMEAQNWQKSHLAQISNSLQTVTTHTELSRVFFNQIAAISGIGHGMLYVYEEESRRLRLLGAYAHRDRKALEQYFELGQGLVGQCAMERAPIVLTEPPADYIHISSGLGEAAPKAISLFPLLRGDRLLGVLELALFEPFGERERALLSGLMPVLAMNLEILERAARSSKLLEETQRQAHALREQASTLEEQAEELEAQKDAIQATETWYRGIIESAPDGLLVADANGLITITNPRLAELFGYHDTELVGRPVEMLVPMAQREGHTALRRDFMQEDKARQMGRDSLLLQGVRKDGSHFPVEVGLSRLPSLGGRGECVCASVRDITERKAAEEALQLASDEQRAIFESATLGIAFIKDRVILRANNRLGELFQRPVAELLNHSTRIWYDSDEAYDEGGGEAYDEVVKGMTHQREQQMRRADGSLFWCKLSGRAVSAGDLSQGTVWMLEDVTETRLAQVKLEERMAELELFNRLTIDREEKMIGLKSEINSLLAAVGQPAKYRIVE